mmetsp:Transcript_91542/g.133841  ORF Transcript_91542/g.133841 Transcript_91542/m.133841 type:complete len:99 (-) Transcript_91542:366-662(-)
MSQDDGVRMLREAVDAAIRVCRVTRQWDLKQTPCHSPLPQWAWALVAEAAVVVVAAKNSCGGAVALRVPPRYLGVPARANSSPVQDLWFAEVTSQQPR